MKKIIALWKGMPREMRTVLAMAGLASPFGLFYLLKRVLFPKLTTFQVFLIIFGVIAAVALIGWIVTKVFGFGGKRRSKKMAKDLASDADSGRVSMDHRAAIKANNEKFFTAITDMKKNLGISVYDLPWYIVIGDSGCGKTKLINEGGLTFSTGRPEGYQLGTLNYNWWFTEDAIFVDMAGRLCNPQDDGDRKEWGAFLDTIAKGRKGYPINGAIVCISADHLLQDPPEKIENDANVALERLRDLQGKLGVTFATYLVITKCDKVLGFMQFFDRAERDITIKNQMFGTSREGEFTELYDPDKFVDDFDKLYGRLNDLRLRRLNDDADEIDLGLAYSFPEEFREFKEPLQTYVRTLFPMIKNPRAIKNLLYRGIFFTSATQEGELILKHLTERLGSEAASQFSPLDLYPNKRPHFIKDVLFKKVFPEQGLVFRNQEEAVKNRKLAKLLWWGAGVAFVALFGLAGLASLKFGGVIGKPRDHVNETKVKDPWEPKSAAERATVLAGDIKSLKENRFWAMILSTGVGYDEPVTNIEGIRAALFEREILSPALLSVSQALREKASLGRPGVEESRAGAQAYQDALEQYVTWYGSSGKDRLPDFIKFEGFKAMCSVVDRDKQPDSPIVSKDIDFLEEAKNYFSVIRDDSSWDNPAKRLRQTEFKAEETIVAAVGKLRDYLEGYATLDGNHPDPRVAEWMRNHACCTTILAAYGDMINFPSQLDQVKEFRDRFKVRYPEFKKAWEDIAWRSNVRAGRSLPDLIDALAEARGVWVEANNTLLDAYKKAGGKSEDPAAQTIEALQSGEGEKIHGLDRTLWQNLKIAELTGQDYSAGNYDNFKEQTRGVVQAYDYIIRRVSGDDKDFDQLDQTAQVDTVDRVLSQIHDNLALLDESTGGGTPEEWIKKLDQIIRSGASSTTGKKIEVPDLKDLHEDWKAGRLQDLVTWFSEDIGMNQGSALLRSMETAMESVRSEPWGFARLYPDRDMRAAVGSAYTFPTPTWQAGGDTTLAAEPTERTPEPPPQEEAPVGLPQLGGSPDPAPKEPVKQEPVQPVKVAEAKGQSQKPACADQTYLLKRAQEMFYLISLLQQLEPGKHFSDSDSGLTDRCEELVKRTGQQYMRQYVTEWSQAYSGLQLRELDKVLSSASNWSSLSGALSDGSQDAIGKEAEAALSEMLQCLAFWQFGLAENRQSWIDQLYPAKATFRPIAAEVQSWMSDAISSAWSGDAGNPVAAGVELPGNLNAGNSPPWDVVAKGFRERWSNLSRPIMRQQDLPSKFPATNAAEPISWGEISALQDQSRLHQDGRITDRLIKFEERARAALSAEMTNRLVGVQDRHFQGHTPDQGWPYLSGGSSTLATVDIGPFKDFLREVAEAARYFEGLDSGQKVTSATFSDSARTARDSFIASCKAWQDLIAQPLRMNVEYVRDYRGDEVQDFAQNFYNKVIFDLGEVSQIEIATQLAASEEQKTADFEWQWRGAKGKQIKFKLTDGREVQGISGRYPDVDQVVGDASPLGLVAYLHFNRKGGGSDQTWMTLHSIDLKKTYNDMNEGDLVGTVPEGARRTGAAFYFTPGRNIPLPITRLQTAR